MALVKAVDALFANSINGAKCRGIRSLLERQPKNGPRSEHQITRMVNTLPSYFGQLSRFLMLRLKVRLAASGLLSLAVALV
jgi:hypothetical protein